LTADGKNVIERLRLERQKAIDAIWLPLDPDALVHFSNFSSQLIERIERFATQGLPIPSTRSNNE
jgi:hypothetical protein